MSTKSRVLKNYIAVSLVLWFSVLFIACSGTESTDLLTNNVNESSEDITQNDLKPEYEQISQSEAKNLIDNESRYIILDVRRLDEFEEKHIPGAICVPVETIEDEPPKELPDKDQLILVYCRSGGRSKDASKKLAEMGYTNIKEFGGIIDWEYETVSGIDEAEEESSMNSEYLIEIIANDVVMYAEFEDNSSADAFRELLSEGSVTINMSDYGNFEKVGDIGTELPRNDEQITTEPGDIILYQGNKITIYYDTNSWNFTKLGRITSIISDDSLKEVLGEGDVTVRFSLVSATR